MKSQELELLVHTADRFAGVRCIGITSNDKYVISGGADGFISFSDLESRSIEKKILAHNTENNAGVICLDISQDNHFLATGGADSLVNL